MVTHHQRALWAQTKQFIKENRAAALSTVTPDGLPHVSTVYCLVKDDLSIYFGTRVEARKFQNITFQPIVAMMFINEARMASVQLTGKATRIDDFLHEQDIFYDLMMLRHEDSNWPSPPMKLLERGATNELAVMRVVPTELTYATFATQPSGRYKPFFEQVI